MPASQFIIICFSNAFVFDHILDLVEKKKGETNVFVRCHHKKKTGTIMVFNFTELYIIVPVRSNCSVFVDSFE